MIARWFWLVALVVAAGSVCLATGVSGAATSSVVVTLDVLTASTIDTVGCVSGASGGTSFGAVLPDTSAVTNLPCDVEFGSSNGTARLSISQADGIGDAMWKPAGATFDAAFGTGGIQEVIAVAAPGTDVAEEIAAGHGGTVVVAGSCNPGGGSNHGFCATRLLSSGAPDPLFGAGGTTYAMVGDGLGIAKVTEVVVDTDGTVLLGGYCQVVLARWQDFCLAKFGDDGVLDPGFGGDGIVSTNLVAGGADDLLMDLLLLADGRVLAVGACDNGVTSHDACLARFEQDGDLDPSFGNAGHLIVQLAAGVAYDGITQVAVQRDGAVIVGGTCADAVTGDDMCFARLVGDATDPTFAGDGVANITFDPGAFNDNVAEMVVLGDDRIVATGVCNIPGSSFDMCTTRLDANGGADATFAGDGTLHMFMAPPGQKVFVYTLLARADGTVLVGGACNMMGSTGYDACLVRLRSDGTPDPTFDGDGTWTWPLSTSTNPDSFEQMVESADGTITTYGWCITATAGVEACATRLDGGVTVGQYSSPARDWDSAVGGHFAACLSAVTAGTATWTPGAGCPATDGAWWRAVPTTASQIASANPNQPAAVASLRFGLRSAVDQEPGSYVAPITFEVAAP